MAGLNDLNGVRRLRVYAAEYGARAGVVAAVAGLLLLAVAGVGMGVPTETFTEKRSPQTLTTNHTVMATVEESVAPYRRNQTLRNAPRYILDAAPRATVNSTTRLPANGTAEVRLVLTHAAHGDGENPTTFWSTRRVLDTATVEAGERTARVGHTLNVSAIRRRAFGVASNFGAGTVVDTAVVTEVAYQIGPYEGVLRTRSPVRFPNQQVYVIEPASGERTETRTVSGTRIDREKTIAGTAITPTRAGVWLFGAALLGLGAWFLYGDQQFDPAEERRKLHAARYRTFITEVDGPVTYGWPDKFVVSLEALANYAIDTNNQIIGCNTTGVYLVRDDGDVLVYDPRIDEWDPRTGAPRIAPTPDAIEESPEGDTVEIGEGGGGFNPDAFGEPPDLGDESDDETGDDRPPE